MFRLQGRPLSPLFFPAQAQFSIVASRCATRQPLTITTLSSREFNQDVSRARVVTILDIEAGALMIARRDKAQAANLARLDRQQGADGFRWAHPPRRHESRPALREPAFARPARRARRLGCRDGACSPSAHRNAQRSGLRADRRRSLQSLGELGDVIDKYL
jgi:hypothetical protein